MNDRPLPRGDARSRLLGEADRCVKCGLCLAACPTYRLFGLEAESPRGRIALVQGLLQGDLAASPRLESHLDNCLACRACEAACPSGVRYGDLIDGVRAALRRPRSALRRATLWALSRPAVVGAAMDLARRLGFGRSAGLLPRRAARLLRLLPDRRAERYVVSGAAPAALARRGRVGLFLGCVARSADAPVHAAAKSLLETLGFDVVIPDRQGCCGAMHRHAGELDAARRLAAAYRRAWTDTGVAAVLFTATGCGAALREHDRWLGEGADATVPAIELTSFLAALDWSALALGPLAVRVAVHVPCSARQAGLEAGSLIDLLARIPGLEATLLDPDLGCCGAAGTYVLHHAANADALRERTLDAIAASGASVVLTTNVGCAMHLRAGLAERGLAIRVGHPAELLAEATTARSAVDSR